MQNSRSSPIVTMQPVALAVLLREDRKTYERAKGVKAYPKKGRPWPPPSFVRADYIGQIFQITPVPGI
jgi:hypothetical protein